MASSRTSATALALFELKGRFGVTNEDMHPSLLESERALLQGLSLVPLSPDHPIPRLATARAEIARHLAEALVEAHLVRHRLSPVEREALIEQSAGKIRAALEQDAYELSRP